MPSKYHRQHHNLKISWMADLKAGDHWEGKVVCFVCLLREFHIVALINDYVFSDFFESVIVQDPNI